MNVAEQKATTGDTGAVFRRRKRKVQLQGGQVCPLCRDALPTKGEALAVCPRCETVYHEGCVRELGGGACVTRGCGGGPRVRDETEPEPVAVGRNQPNRQESLPFKARTRRSSTENLFIGVLWLALTVLFSFGWFHAETTQDELLAALLVAMGCGSL